MHFLRQYLFYVILAAVLIVSAAVMIPVMLGLNEKIDEQVAVRSDLNEQFKRLQRPPLVNTATLTDKQKQVEQMKAAAEEITRQTVNWNRRNYKILKISENQDAFPFYADQPEFRNMEYTVTQQYLVRMGELLAQLKPTTIPTAADIESAAMQEELKIRKRVEVEERNRRRAEAVGASAAVPASGSPTAYGAVGGSVTVSTEAKLEGVRSARLRKARDGRVYATLDSLDLLFPAPTPSASLVQLWAAQLNLWVTQDIIHAIAKTNEDALAKAGIDPANGSVINVPIKRLIKLDVGRQYFNAKGESFGVSAVVVTAAPTIDMTSGDPGATGDPGAAGGAPDMMPGVVDPGSLASAGTGGNLTMRVCTPEYDVLHYQVKLLMPMRAVPIFQRNLEAENFHTVLSVDVNWMPDLMLDSYYYGAEPVVQVTILGELLLMTPWERGTFDSKENKWSKEMPDLIPVDMLRQLRDAGNAAALRPEDTQRLAPR